KFFGAFSEVINPVVVLAQYGRDRLKVMFEAAFADVEDSFFSLIHYIVNTRPLIVSNRGDLIGGVDHLAADGISLYDAPIRFCIQRGGTWLTSAVRYAGPPISLNWPRRSNS